jgi:cell wall-associated NlpC family hydrolase
MMNKLISVSLTVKNRVLHGSNWLSTCSLFTMIVLLVMCRPHLEVAKSHANRPHWDKVTPYPVSVRLNPDSVRFQTSLYAHLALANEDELEEQKANDNWRSNLIRFAMKYLGKPYRSGGKTPSGFDCSGFTGFVFAHFGLRLPSNSGSQAMIGEKVNVKEAKKGDLAFFGWKTKKGFVVNHAAIVVSNPGEPLKIIHSATGQGITLTAIHQSDYWERMLLFVRRVTLKDQSEG